jgi:hypothetical protein
MVSKSVLVEKVWVLFLPKGFHKPFFILGRGSANVFAGQKCSAMSKKLRNTDLQLSIFKLLTFDQITLLKNITSIKIV